MSVGPRVALAVSAFALLAVAVSGHAAADIGAAQPQLDTDGQRNLTIVIDVRPDGDARFTVSTTFNLTTDTRREAFGDVATAFENGETTKLGLPTYRRASELVSDATGREMEITDVTYSATPPSEIENGTGRLAVQFTWTNFGRPDGERLHVDDAFRTGQGTWLPGLGPGDSLIIRAPEGYGVIDSNVAPKVRNNRSILRWTGPTEFDASTTQAVFTGQAGVVTPTPTPTPTPNTPSPTPTDTATPPPNGQTASGGLPWALLFTVGLGGGIVAVYLLARHRDGLPVPSSPSAGTDADAAEDTASSETTAAASAGASEADGDPSPAATAGTNEESERDVELLSDEERVERLLDQNGGRMKQADIVKETGWSNAKVSQLLSSMEEDGRIDKLRIGRENLISFPDVDVTDFDE